MLSNLVHYETALAHLSLHYLCVCCHDKKNANDKTGSMCWGSHIMVNKQHTLQHAQEYSITMIWLLGKNICVTCYASLLFSVYSLCKVCVKKLPVDNYVCKWVRTINGYFFYLNVDITWYCAGWVVKLSFIPSIA